MEFTAYYKKTPHKASVELYAISFDFFYNTITYGYIVLYPYIPKKRTAAQQPQHTKKATAKAAKADAQQAPDTHFEETLEGKGQQKLVEE